MTASNVNNVVLSQTTIGGSGSDLGFTNPLTVTLATTQDEESLTKNLIIIGPPTGQSNQVKNTSDPNYGPADSKVIDLLNKVEQRFEIDGYLVTGLGDSDSSNDAEGKKADLKKIYLGGGVTNMKYEGSVFTVVIDKLSIKRDKFDGVLANDGEAQFSVKFSCVKGVKYGE